MNEAETRAELIDPAIKAAGWGVAPGSRVGREVYITLGRLQGAGKRAKPDIADYVLIYRDQKLAVIEAKKRDASDTEGLQQAKNYAGRLAARFAYSTNGRRIYQVDMHTGQEGYVDAYPTPDELWAIVFPEQKPWRDRFAAVPYEDGGGKFQPRFYQHNAINAALEAIADGRDRILLTLATGTGKTAIAFQLAWKLFHSRWNLTDWRNGTAPSRRPRILFLADRNILANQAKNDFSAFPDDAMARISPEEIRKQGRVPKNASVFFTIFQTFMTGTDAEGNPAPNFGQYPPDFFDLIIIDECHRGGAKDESTWRGILEHFKPAVQLGLTATPRRKDNVDTYAYFGEPVYIYSLKEGINDGFLTPFKVRQISTTLDEYVYTSDDMVLEGEIEEGRRYTEADFNRVIEIEGREAYRVKTFMEMIDQSQKTIVFCATQEHALAVRNLINQMKTSKDPNYCVRVTADDGKIGETFLKQFQDNEKTIPTILTTSQKLSTGVNARNIRNIVLMRPVNNLIEFKQIVGRGTRLYEGKDYFTIYDFVRAYEHFQDPEWDGEPLEPVAKPERPPGEPRPLPEPHEPEDGHGGEDEEQPRQRIRIKLADGKERQIQHMSSTSFWSADGRPMSAAEFVQQLFGDLPALFKDEAELRELWSRPDTRKALLEALYEKGYGPEQLGEMMKLIDAENSDLFDVLAYVAFAQSPITRQQRVEEHRGVIAAHYDEKLQTFIDFVLAQYVQEGVEELDQTKLPQLLALKYHAITDAEFQLGSVSRIREVFIEFQKYLYTGVA
jgi:type I restriction enzyme R subunit